MNGRGIWGWVFAGLAFVGLLLAAGAAFAKGNGTKGKTTPKDGPGGGGDFFGPTDPRPIRKILEELEDEIPAGDLFDARGLYISEDCEWVLEGPAFWPARPGTLAFRALINRSGDPDDPTGIRERCQGVTTMAGVIFATTFKADPSGGVTGEPGASQCTVLDLFDTRMLQEGQTDPKLLADAIVRETAPLCFDAPVDTWPEGFAIWYDYFVERVREYVELKLDRYPNLEG